MIRINQIKIFHDINAEISHDELSRILKKKAAKLLRVSENDIKDFEIIRHSIDARKKPDIFDIYMVDLKLKGGSEEQIVKKSRDKNASVIADKKYDFWKQALNSDDKEGLIKKASACDKKIVVIGAGPAGLFCAYELARNGFKPLLLERGAAVEKRMELVNKFWETGVQIGRASCRERV